MSTLAPLVGKGSALVHQEPHRLTIASGAVRSGKTVSTLVAFATHVRHRPGRRAIVARTEQTAERNVVGPLQEMFGKKLASYRKGELTLFGQPCHVVGVSTEQSYTRLAGMTLQGAYADEITLWPENAWQMLATRLSLPDARLWGTNMPASPAHWFLTDWLSKARTWVRLDGSVERAQLGLDLARYDFRLADNPWLPDDYIAGLRQMFSGAFLQRYIEGLWVAASGSIYPNVLEQVWQGELPLIVAWYVGIDWGSTNPTAAVLIGETANNQAIVVSEFYHDSAKDGGQWTHADAVAAIRAWLGRCGEQWPGASAPRQVVIDSAEAPLVAAARRAGWPAVGADKGSGSVVESIRIVESMLSTRRLWIVAANCPKTLEEHEGYVWDEQAQRKGEDAPVKHADHTPDAVRYVAMARSGAWLTWMR